MSDLIIYGASDDLIEVEGLLRDELNPPYAKPALVTIKVDGVPHARLRVEYDPDESGEWRIEPTEPVPSVRVVAARGEDMGADDDGCPGYSDKAVVDMAEIAASRIRVSVKKAR